MQLVSETPGGRPAVAGRRVCFVCALVAVAMVFAWTALRVHYAFGGNWSIVFCTGKNFPPPPELAAGTYQVEGGGYDGQFYRYLAHDPFLQRGYARYCDSPQLRFRRLLIPLAAWTLAAGRQDWIDGAFFAVEMLFLGAGVYWCARLLVRRGRSGWWGLLFVIVPATLASFDRMLVDGPLAALFAGFWLYAEEQRWRRVWIIAMLAALTRDTGLAFGAALVLERLLNRDWRKAAAYGLTVVPALAWYAFIAARLPKDQPVIILGAPVWSLIQRLLLLRTYPDPRVELLLRVTDVLATLGLAASLAIAAWWAWRRPLTPVAILVLSFAALGALLGAPSHLYEAFGFSRPISPLLLWLMLEAVARRKWIALAPPLTMTLSVCLVFGYPFIAVVKGLLGR